MARPRNRLNLDRLESRDLMSGNVIARVNMTGGFPALFVGEAEGQAGQPNSVQISQLANGATRVAGLINPDGTRTLVNGLAFQDFDNGLLSLAVELGRGNDRLRITSDPLRPADARYAFVTVGMSTPNSPPDADTVELSHVTTAGTVDISTGAGADHVVVRDSEVGTSFDENHRTLDIRTGAGVDHVDIGPTNSHDLTSVRVHGNLIVNTFESITEPEADFVRMFQTTVDQTVGVSTGGGNDSVRMGVVFGGNVTMVTGQGNDTGLLQDVRAGDHMFLGMSEGNDSLDVSGLEAVNLLTIDGFSGFDRLQDHAGGAIGKKVVTGWEVINGVLVTGSHAGTVGGLGGGGALRP
jgi:hypothetical protein